MWNIGLQGKNRTGGATEKSRRAGGGGMDGQMEATEKDSVLMSDLGM